MTKGPGLSTGLVKLAMRPADDAVLDLAALHVVDWFGCVLAAASEPVASKLVAWAAAQRQSGRSFALGLGETGPETAAFVNGGLGNVLEMDDLHRASLLHAGDVVIPAALAAAQATNADGKTLLKAVLAGYEAAIRIGVAAAETGYSAWFNTGTCGIFGAALSAAIASGAPQEQCAAALAHAGMQAAGLWQCRLETTDMKQLATAHAARAGVDAARLAIGGMLGARHILEGELGFFRTFYPDARPETVLDRPDADWLLKEVSFKPWPACRHAHPAIYAALMLRDRIPIEAIRNVEIRTYRAAIAFCDQPKPQTDHEARFSIQHAVAAALVHGPPRLEHFHAEMRGDRVIGDLAARIRLAEDARMTTAFPRRLAASMLVETRDGQKFEAATPDAPGDPEIPLSAADLARKFRANASHGGVSASGADALLQSIFDLRHAPDLEDIGRAMYALRDTAGPKLRASEKG